MEEPEERQVLDESGRVREKHILLNGRLHGDSVTYDAEGRVARTAQFKDGAVDGEVVTYDAAGRVRERCQFQGGVPHGELTLHDERGWLIQRMSFLAGRPEGECVIFGDGRPTAFLHYRNGIPEGELRVLYPSGPDSVRSLYRDGQLEGESVFFDPEGNLVRRAQYRGGKLQARPSSTTRAARSGRRLPTTKTSCTAPCSASPRRKAQGEADLPAGETPRAAGRVRRQGAAEGGEAGPAGAWREEAGLAEEAGTEGGKRRGLTRRTPGEPFPKRGDPSPCLGYPSPTWDTPVPIGETPIPAWGTPPRAGIPLPQVGGPRSQLGGGVYLSGGFISPPFPASPGFARQVLSSTLPDL